MLSVIYSISLLVAVCASQSVHAQNKDIFDVERPNNNNNNNFNNDHLYNKNIFANSLENSDFGKLTYSRMIISFCRFYLFINRFRLL